MLNFCDFIQVYVFTTNQHLKNGRKRMGGGGVRFNNTVELQSLEH